MCSQLAFVCTHFVVLKKGHLKGYDHLVNVILEHSHERVFSEDSEMVENPLGLYIIRGDNM